ncbi:MAG TPA: tetratricopeptide repeat protein [Leptolyngbyaceae cyanobacterium M33_DOE_097]|uniref:Tetratricopeptide repeat protein n=1 Tax=Oscillatoriales cyanobacterium SpSt-418 TaxID=2282169 RepID=A0A7C3PMH4_9CYAN|nr:tetratricopeptide repeat protein [Leptolyngbyaceae cyanobacterium M33_DOE_097]
MPPVPESSSTPSQAAIANTEAGLAAYKQGDYGRAIALLQQAATLPTNHPLYVKAQMGLTVAYARQGEWQKSLELCQLLGQYPDPEVQAWARRTEAGVAKRACQQAGGGTPVATTYIPASDQSGFVPLEGDPAEWLPEIAGDRAESGFETEANTGFVPFEAVGQTTPVDAPATVAQNSAVMLPETTERGVAESEWVASTATPDVNYQPQWKQAGRAQRWQPLRAAKPSAPTQGLIALALLWVFLRIIPVTEVPLGFTTLPLAHPAAEFVIFLLLLWEFVAGRVNGARLFLLQLVTAIALFAIVRELIYQIPNLFNVLLAQVPFINYSYEIANRPTLLITSVLAVGFVASRWLLDGLLWLVYGMQPLPLQALSRERAEIGRSLQSFCRKRKIPTPALGVLPTQAPFIMSYGCLPRFTRTVVSQGLLDQLAEDEIITLLANEVGQISYRTVPLLSFAMLVLQVPYTIYLFTAEWGNRQIGPLLEQMMAQTNRVPWLAKLNAHLSGNARQRRSQPIAGAYRGLDAALRDLAVLVAALAYGVYRLFRYIPLWLARQRTYYSDRVAAELTGNPNGLTRALLKYAIGTAAVVQAEGKTPYLLEGFDLLPPVGHKQAVSLGSVYPLAPLQPFVEWDWTNPYRNWLVLNESHPPVGDRLRLLALYAQYWKLDTELDFKNPRLPYQSKAVLTGAQWRRLLVQGAPFFGLVFGLALVHLLSWLGYVGGGFNISWLAWLQNDATVRYGLPLIGFSSGIFLRVNPFFPNIPAFGRSRSGEGAIRLKTLLNDPEALPIDADPVYVTGHLIGRSGASNFLSQDWLLQTESGIVRLHVLHAAGPIGNLLNWQRFTALLNQEVSVSGWFRRGAVPWIDVETIRAGNQTVNCQHPIWSTLVASIAAIWGIFQIAFGGTNY